MPLAQLPAGWDHDKIAVGGFRRSQGTGCPCHISRAVTGGIKGACWPRTRATQHHCLPGRAPKIPTWPRGWRVCLRRRRSPAFQATSRSSAFTIAGAAAMSLFYCFLQRPVVAGSHQELHQFRAPSCGVGGALTLEYGEAAAERGGYPPQPRSVSDPRPAIARPWSFGPSSLLLLGGGPRLFT